MFSDTIFSECLVEENLDCFFNIFIVFVSEKMGKKANLFGTKKAQIVILHYEGFSQKKICKKVSCSKTAVH